MTTHLPAPPILPKAREAFEREAVGAALAEQTPPKPLSIAHEYRPSNSHENNVNPMTNAIPNTVTQNGLDLRADRAHRPPRPAAQDLPAPTAKHERVGLTLNKDGLHVHASGTISDIYGPAFAVQDNVRRQTRIPQPPLLLVDRLLGIDAPPATIGAGTLWTETDVTAGSWWLHQGRMPAGIMLESAQADRMLISWMGADFAHQGDRVYRLLGCEVTFFGGLPKIDDTLRFDIHVHGHGRLGDIPLFFVHYDCAIDGVKRLSVRDAQVGFFSDEELASSSGICWHPETETVTGPSESTTPKTSRTSLSRSDLETLAAGQIWPTLGPGFERAASHTRTPRIGGGDMLFVDEVTQLDFSGGPWHQGYLRAVQHVAPDTWFFASHVKDDPHMPGTLMYEGAMQAMALYMTSLGMTVECDGWRFEPVPFETYKLRFRGQVTPRSRELVYEVFVREILAGPEPTLFADLLCTVDGMPVFHCRRMGLKLSPGWPMDLGAKELTSDIKPKPAAEVEGFRFDHTAMLAWATGKPSTAFGPRYQGFDSHRIMVRLPGPPYSFISRVTDVVGHIGVMESDAEVVGEYDIPCDAWYFTENGRTTMPNAVLMEVALQPCGWLASYIGCPLSTDVDLYFRNLDGTGIQHQEVTPSTGTLRTKVALKNIAQAAETIIVSFTAETYADDSLVYTIDTVFGFFRREALEQQVGLQAGAEERRALQLPSELPVVDLRARPEKFFGPGARLAGPMLLMIDRVTGRWPAGGSAGLGQWRAVKDVDPTEWFFTAHFYRDPVQPGSLGIEALLSLLQFAMLDLGLGQEAGPSACFEPVALHEPITWRYRGQVLPTNKLITSLVEITRITRDDNGILAVADASLWVDDIRIYRAANLAMRIKQQPLQGQWSDVTGSSSTAQETLVETIIDPACDSWITDHCPTYTTPALPMMSVMDLFAQAASQVSATSKVVEVADLRVDRWIIVDSPKRLRVVIEPTEPGRFSARLELWRDAPKAVLSRWETHAHATIVTADNYGAGPTLPPPLHDAVPLADPYATGAFFHGPAFFSVMDDAWIGSNGSSGRLSVQQCKVPAGRLHPGLLDGAMHIVPHTALSVWTTEGANLAHYPEVNDTDVAMPHRVARANFYSDTPLEGEVDVEVRFVGFDDADRRRPVVDLWLSVADQPWAFLRVVGILLPKGPLGQASGLARRAFLGQRRAVPAMSLSQRQSHGVVKLDAARLASLDWLQGTSQALYRTDSRGDSLLVDIASKEAIACAAHNAIHPSHVQIVDGQVSCPTLPLEQGHVDVEQTNRGEFRASASLHTDWQPVRSWWTDRLGMPQGWFGDLLNWALLSRYARHVIVTDPAALAAIRGRPVLLLGNHQVLIESILATMIASWLTDTRVVPIAGIKMETHWVGELTRCLDTQAARDLGIMRYFNQQTPQQFFGLIEEIKRDTADHGVSSLVHPDGTRYFRSGQRVERLTSTLLDMAIDMSMPIVPIYFAGGLPEEPVDPKLEVPYRHAAQDYIFGRPIMPEELAALLYAHRRRHVIDAINALAPFSNAPHDPNIDVENRIAAIAPGASPLESVWDCIEDALNALPVDWRSTISSDEWMATRSPRRQTSTSGIGRT